MLSSSSWGERTRGWGPPSSCQVRDAGAGRAGWVQVGTDPASLPGPGGGGGAQVRLCLPPGDRMRAKPWTQVAAGSCSYLALLHPPPPHTASCSCCLTFDSWKCLPCIKLRFSSHHFPFYRCPHSSFSSTYLLLFLFLELYPFSLDLLK